MSDFSRFEELLSNEKFPLSFTFKVVGRTGGDFEKQALALESEFPGLTLSSTRQSAQGNHVSLTFIRVADSPEAILSVYRRIHALPDVLFVL